MVDPLETTDFISPTPRPDGPEYHPCPSPLQSRHEELLDRIDRKLDKVIVLQGRHDERLESVERRVDGVENNQIWMARLIVGAVILALIGTVIAQGGQQ